MLKGFVFSWIQWLTFIVVLLETVIEFLRGA